MSNSEVNWIWMTPKWPLPPEDGARQATFHLIRGLTEKGAKIHLCAIVPRDSEIAEPERESERKILGVTKVTCLPKKNPTLLARAWSLLSDPFTRSRCSHGCSLRFARDRARHGRRAGKRA